MSIRIMSRVWEMPDVAGPELLVMLALADFADDDGTCWPAMKSIARKCRMSDRGVRGIIRRLEAQGYLKCTESRGRTHSNRYHINTENRNEMPIKDTLKPERETGNDVPISAVKPERESTKIGTLVPPNRHRTVKEGSKEPIRKVFPKDVLAPILGKELAADVVEHRRKLGAPMTVRAAELLGKRLIEYHDPIAGAEAMIASGWQGFKAEWMNGRHRDTGPPPIPVVNVDAVLRKRGT